MRLLKLILLNEAVILAYIHWTGFGKCSLAEAMPVFVDLRNDETPMSVTLKLATHSQEDWL